MALDPSFQMINVRLPLAPYYDSAEPDHNHNDMDEGPEVIDTRAKHDGFSASRNKIALR